jgi:hypothetical protein
MLLTDIIVRNIKAKDKQYKLTDEKACGFLFTLTAVNIGN